MTTARTIRGLAKALGKHAALNLSGRQKKRRLAAVRELKAVAREIAASEALPPRRLSGEVAQ